jgi:hypothetical protein
VENSARLDRFRSQQRTLGRPQAGDLDLGLLSALPGKWQGRGTGWNMIALPFFQPDQDPSTQLFFRLLLNQYDEDLNVFLADKAVPNRGLGQAGQTDQFVVALDYEQQIRQIAAADHPESTVKAENGVAIHHEPGLFLNMVNEAAPGQDIARLATIPHGDAVLAIGTGQVTPGGPVIPAVTGLPEGAGAQDIKNNPYLEPYKFFHDNPFTGAVTADGFPGFDPVAPHLLLQLANQGVNIVNTTTLDLATTTATGGINNIPFIVAQANAASMRSFFWIQEVRGEGSAGPQLRLQYLQIVMLDFFPRLDGFPGLISWPHISINTLRKVSDTPDSSGGYAGA